MSLRRRVLRFVRNQGMVVRGERVLVACSGGADSVVLTSILADLSAEIGIDVGVCSIDHGLRDEAQDEVSLVRRMAADRGLPFFARRIDVPDGASLQAHARRERYAALFEVARENDFGCIATGHTRDDQAETVLARLFRSGTIAGLAAISPKRDDGVIRPLLNCSKQQVLEHAKQSGLAYVRDPSNLDIRFERVRMRALLPALREENELIDERLAQLAEQARAHRDVVEAWAQSVGTETMELSRAKLLELPTAVAHEVLSRWVAVQGGRVLGSQMQAQAYALVQLGKGELWLSDTLQLCAKDASICLQGRS